jgi:uncharacterized protein
MKRSAQSRPWWKEPLVWMVISGPLAAVVAGTATAVVAFTNPDRVIASDSYSHGQADAATAKARAALQPAQKARNHSATGGVVR